MCELTARHGRVTAWARHVMCESALMLPFIEKQRTKIQYFIILKSTATKIKDFIKQVNQNSIYKELMIKLHLIVSLLQQ
jgi:hypothetical protein